MDLFGFSKAGQMIEGYKKLKTGMSKAEVVSSFGEPTGQRLRNGIETLIWRNNEFKGLFRGGTIERTIEVDFENEKVTGWDGQNINLTKW